MAAETRRRTDGWRRLAGLAVLLAAAQFAVIWPAAMLRYPGGNEFDRQAVGYSFWRNTLSDLGASTAVNGQPSRMAPAFNVSLGLLFPALVLIWISLPGRLACASQVRSPIVALGAISGLGGVAVAVSLALGSATGHMVSIGAAAISGLAALALTCLVMALGRMRTMACLSLGMLVVGSIHFGQYVAHFWLGHAWTPAMPATQKVAVVYALCWMAAVGRLLRRKIPSSKDQAPNRQQAT